MGGIRTLRSDPKARGLGHSGFKWSRQCPGLLSVCLRFSPSAAGVLPEKDYEVYRDYSADGHLLHCR